MNQQTSPTVCVRMFPWETRVAQEVILHPSIAHTTKFPKEGTHRIILPKDIFELFIAKERPSNVCVFSVDQGCFDQAKANSILDEFYLSMREFIFERLKIILSRVVATDLVVTAIIFCSEEFGNDFVKCFDRGVDDVIPSLYKPSLADDSWIPLRIRIQSLQNGIVGIEYEDPIAVDLVSLS